MASLAPIVVRSSGNGLSAAATASVVVRRQLHSSSSPILNKDHGTAHGLPKGGWAMHRIDQVSPKLRVQESLQGRTLFISGASRGIGLAIGLRAAKDGANVVIAAKTTEPHPKLEGTIYTAAEQIEAAGGKALPVFCDIREEQSVQSAVDAAVEKFGGIDILVNNASAINLSNTQDVEMKRYDLMNSINARGTFLCTKLCLPHLKNGTNPHVLNLAPPIQSIQAKWFAGNVAYSMAKFGMSMCVVGHSAEFRPHGIAVNALWPRTTIATAAVKNLLGGDPMVARSRIPDIMGDAAHAIFLRDSKKCTGNFFIDDEVMVSEGVTDLSVYNVDPSLPQHELFPDFFV